MYNAKYPKQSCQASVQKKNKNTQEVKIWMLYNYIWPKENSVHSFGTYTFDKAANGEQLFHKKTVKMSTYLIESVAFLPCGDQVSC